MTDNIQNGERVEVIQSDRDFAAAWIVIAPENARRIRNGEWDSHHGVQAAAKHRHSLAREPATADVERLREAAMEKAREEGAPDEDILCFKMAYQYYDKIAKSAAPSSEPAIAEGERIARMAADLERMAGALEAIQERARKASAEFNCDRAVPSVKQMIALGVIQGDATHHLAGIDLVRLNALAATSTPPASKGVEA